MKKKRFFAKILSFIFCLTFVFSNMLAVNAEDLIVTERNYEQIEVIYNAASSFSVIIPKQIVLNANKQSSYPVQVTGDIAFNQRVHVAPIDAISQTDDIDFYMEDQTSNSKKEDVVATVTQSKTYWSSADVANCYEEMNNTISAPDLTAGTWKGIFQVEISLETEEHIHDYIDGVCTGCGGKDPNAEHTHNYVDGKCECGEIDPNHEHNYEDGTCTVCGDEETDPYDTAPASAYSNWNYTLDDVNDIITLNYYTGSETDVIVYGNYEIDGKVYKTQIANAPDLYLNNNPTWMFNGKLNCKQIRTITFSNNVDTSICTNLNRMFYNCTALISVNFGNGFNTSNVTNMYGMFYDCKSLTEIVGLENFDTSKVTHMGYMFNNCNLSIIDLSSFDTSNVTNMYAMFYNDKNLKTIYVTSGKWVTSQASTGNMFTNCGVSSVTYR